MNRPPLQRTRSAALLVPVLGLFLLLPPLVTLFSGAARPLGVPLIVLYLFTVWAAMIAATALLARRLDEPPAPGDAAADDPASPPAAAE